MHVARRAAAIAGLLAAAPAGAAEWHTKDDRGVQVQAAVGVLTFPGQVADDVEPGAAFGVLVGIEPVPVAELELSYQGAAYRTSRLVSPQQESVVEHGVQALVKASPQYGAIEPYLFAGYGLTVVQVEEQVGGPGVVLDDTLHKFPFGAGIDFHVPAGGPGGTELLIGARGTYSPIIDNQAYTVADQNDRSADQLAATLNLGAQF